MESILKSLALKEDEEKKEEMVHGSHLSSPFVASTDRAEILLG
eukprot:CAMPEP_0204627890 /NCGR_PEP_ID=MMETSP0717-20131115/14478_1 /ASSEMBLY_ACC=CAM_ASM_000666 /TAXON_ID=230516 /ORGANISM="Chaetoceros curvisetus" /LENGTH=42 /DNA_ID= /DNA_START= /DNA_END= /DNA_ORIENTATION=